MKIEFICPLIQLSKVHMLQDMFVTKKIWLQRSNLVILEVDLHLRASLEFFKERKLVLSFIRMQVCGNHPRMLVLVRCLSLQGNVPGAYRYVSPT